MVRKSQTGDVLLLAIFAVVFLVIIAWWWNQAHTTPEGYNYYRGTGGCPPRAGNNWLDVYKQQDYYKEHPWIYPMPLSYANAWYKGRNKRWHDLYNLQHNIEVQ